MASASASAIHLESGRVAVAWGGSDVLLTSRSDSASVFRTVAGCLCLSAGTSDEGVSGCATVAFSQFCGHQAYKRQAAPAATKNPSMIVIAAKTALTTVAQDAPSSIYPGIDHNSRIGLAQNATVTKEPMPRQTRLWLRIQERLRISIPPMITPTHLKCQGDNHAFFECSGCHIRRPMMYGAGMVVFIRRPVSGRMNRLSSTTRGLSDSSRPTTAG